VVKRSPPQNANFRNLQKNYLPKVNNHPIGENSPNLVTLTPTELKSSGLDIFIPE
jgi:hypothetical protein